MSKGWRALYTLAAAFGGLSLGRDIYGPSSDTMFGHGWIWFDLLVIGAMCLSLWFEDDTEKTKGKSS